MLNTMFEWLGHARYNATPPSTQTGQPVELQCDAQGNLSVNVAAYGSSNWYDSSGLRAQGIIATAPARLASFHASNENRSAKMWLMLFNKASLPNTGDIPVYQIPMLAGWDFTMNLRAPRLFGAGISWGASSTAGSYTAAPSALFWLNVEYI